MWRPRKDKHGRALPEAMASCFHLALVDLQLPEMDGLTLAGCIQKALPALPLLALTAHGEPAYREKALAAGLTGVGCFPQLKKRSWKVAR